MAEAAIVAEPAKPVAAPAATIVKLPSRGTLQISTARVDLADIRRNVWSVMPEEGTAFDTILTESYWAHRAKDFKPGDKIEVRPDECSYYAELYVLAAGANWAKVTPLFKVDLSQVGPVVPGASEYSVDWKGPHRKWSVIRLKDKSILKDGFAQKEEAMAWIPRHGTGRA